MTLRRWNIAVGQFFFKRRNALFPVAILLTILCLRPHVLFGNPAIDRWLMRAGVATALAGECVRLVTIGFEYIDRGGKEGKVYASALVQGGVYALTRNPMYVGNMLIVTGVTMVSGSPSAYVILIPGFLFIYQAIIAAEEEYLRAKFGADYNAFCADVPRFFPALRHLRRAFADRRYRWRYAVRKELSTMAGLFTGLMLLPVWRLYFLQGVTAAQRAFPPAAACAASILILYGFFVYLKRRRLLFYAE